MHLFFDIDGTLAAGPPAARHVPESAREALYRLRAAGHVTVLATGRSHAMARGFFDEHGFEHMVCDGGSGLVVDGEFLGVEPLEREACLALVEELEVLGIPWAVSPEDSCVRIAPDGRFARAIGESYMETRVVDGLDWRSLPQFNKVYVACTRSEEAGITALSGVPHARQMEHCLFVEPVCKARGIERLMGMLGVPVEEVAVFGDGENDASMFDARWLNIAMGNAVPALKELADYVTADADDDGILKACEHFGWI